MESCGWYGNFKTLVAAEPQAVYLALSHYLREKEAPQLGAWEASVRLLQAGAAGSIAMLPDAAEFAAIFEYELPRERGRRADVIVLEDGTVLVLEFKEKDAVHQADLDQVKGYARDLRNYHSECRERRVIPVLVPTRYGGDNEVRDGVHVIPPPKLGPFIVEIGRKAARHRADASVWLRGEYAPLPGLVQASRLLFERMPLPRIRRAASAHIPETLEVLRELARRAATHKERHLAFVTGVPGAGKTLVGLQLAHDPTLDGLGGATNLPAVFLSGNGPLVQVLQYALRNKVFVQDMKGFLKEYALKPDRTPLEHVLVFDEAQRAWDAERVFKKHQAALGKRSEPEALADIAGRLADWAMVVALIGEGQEIHAGEEGGIVQWVDAIERARAPWIVHGPERLASAFGDRGLRFEVHPRLHLSVTLRSHQASELSLWVGLLLQGEIRKAREIAESLRAPEGGSFDMYLSRDLEAVRTYVRRRYEGARDRRYGLIASSKAKNLVVYGIRNSWQDTRFTLFGPWFEGDPEDERSCCQLRDAVTEFGCQGLELDMPIVAWGDDLVWDGSAWRSKVGKPSDVKDPHRLRLNAYRVLLTRGRDGFCVFVPPETHEPMDQSASALLSAGVRELALLPA